MNKPRHDCGPSASAGVDQRSPVTAALPGGWSVSRADDAQMPAVIQLERIVFGPGQFTRTAFRLREQAASCGRWMLVGRKAQSDHLIGSLRMTPLSIGGQSAWLAGPLAVHPSCTKQGLGRALLASALAENNDCENRPVLLIGDLAYYAPFGFCAVPDLARALPGPVDPQRVLIANWRAENPPAGPVFALAQAHSHAGMA